jgi:alkaline phosphatase
MFRNLILYSFLLLSKGLMAQSPEVKIHSHNDYQQETPFWNAFSAQAASIEVDVFLKDGQLYVAHEEETINTAHTLATDYLAPLETIAARYGTQRLGFQLMIDSKTEAYTTLKAIDAALQPYLGFLWPNNPDGARIVISGKRPKPADYGQYPDYIRFDCQNMDNVPPAAWQKIAMISAGFYRLSRWNGKGRFTHKDLERVTAFITKAKSFEKPVRLWATPDSKTAWKKLYDLGVDYINTDQPQRVRIFFNGLADNESQLTEKKEVYRPSYGYLKKVKRPKNVILMIGDGMGLAQISAATLSNGGQLSLTQLTDIGFVQTQAADDFTTDSAAGATAYATGVRTNNRAIGVGPNKKPLENLPQFLSKRGWHTALITTDALTGATPGAFYAHVVDRGEEETMAEQFVENPFTLFAGAGITNFSTEQLERLEENGFEWAASESEISQKGQADRLGLFLAEGALPAEKDGRGNLMPELMEGALGYLEAKKKPFFMLMENGMIDSFGHANNTQGIVTEVLDFDACIAQALRFADGNNETLVIVTADHETGGFSLPQGHMSQGYVQGDFTTHDHTGIMVPIFAYGPGAEHFKGTYPNYEVFGKLLDLLQIQN